MKTRNVDVAIIGAGTAGLNARREAEKAGKDWVMIESGPYGTTCARVGCMPSKLLIAAAESAHNVEQADTFGIRVQEEAWKVDGPAVMERVRRERDRFAGFVVDSTLEIPEEKRLRGHARFVDTHTLEVEGERDTKVHAETFVIATGSHPWIPPSLEEIRDDVMDNADVFELQDMPGSVAVVGTGVIALELGQALDKLGVEVHFFNPYNEVGIFSDPMVDGKAQEVFRDRLNLHVPNDIYKAEKTEDGYCICWRDDDHQEHQMVFDEVLSAAGRRPNLGGLNLEATGVDCDTRGVPRFDPRTMQCGDSHLFIAGDAAGHRPVLHEASDEGRIAGSNAAAYPDVTAGVRRTPMAVAFTDPQMAVVGKRFTEIEPERRAVGEVSYDNQGRARVMDVNCGTVRVYGDYETCEFLGAEMFGPRVEHTAHLLAWAAQRGMSVQAMLEMPYYHPVIEEGIRTALRDLARELKIEGRCRPEDCSDCPGA